MVILMLGIVKSIFWIAAQFWFRDILNAKHSNATGHSAVLCNRLTAIISSKSVREKPLDK